ncbi:hypothetical protein [Mesotoga prima]|jgi:hypothetical protein|uniref:hypothetical protein n=1 Tax=Mesotoga prima TaxID=1184387 RepID=UPI002FD90DFA
MKQEPSYIIASIYVDLSRPISRYSSYRDTDYAKQILKSQLTSLAIQFASNHSLDGIDEFMGRFHFELPPEPPTNYRQEAEDDAANLVLEYFMDEIVDQLINKGEASADINNDYDNGDGIFHEVITDRSYHMTEAAELLSQLYEYAEEDAGLWEGETDVDRIAEIQAAYTYGNAVWDEFDTLIMNINSLDIDDIKFETAIKCLGLKPDDLDDYEKMEELIETAEETCVEYEENLRERLIEEIKNFWE